MHALKSSRVMGPVRLPVQSVTCSFILLPAEGSLLSDTSVSLCRNSSFSTNTLSLTQYKWHADTDASADDERTHLRVQTGCPECPPSPPPPPRATSFTVTVCESDLFFHDVGGNFQTIIHVCANSRLRDAHFFMF